MIKRVTSIQCDRDYLFAESTSRLGLPLDPGAAITEQRIGDFK
jgi:hypothetical protein